MVFLHGGLVSEISVLTSHNVNAVISEGQLDEQTN